MGKSSFIPEGTVDPLEYATAANEAMKAYLKFYELSKKVINHKSREWQRILKAGDAVLHEYGFAYYVCAELDCFPFDKLNSLFDQDVKPDFFIEEGLGDHVVPA